MSKNRKNYRHCLKFLRLLFNVLILFGFMQQVEGMERGTSLKSLNPYSKVRSRGLANFTPDDDVQVAPFEHDLWVETAIEKDETTILKAMKDQIIKWEKNERYAKQWNLESTGMYLFPTVKEKRSYLQKWTLKYFDKYISGEVKKADEGSTFASVGKVQTALRPNTKMKIGKNIKIKFRARVLQGRGFIVVDNPYVDCKTQFNVRGRLNMRVGKKFKEIGTETSVQYNVDESDWIASIDQQITSTVSARISSAQSHDSMAFTDKSDRVAQIFYGYSF